MFHVTLMKYEYTFKKGYRVGIDFHISSSCPPLVLSAQLIDSFELLRSKNVPVRRTLKVTKV